MGSKRLMLAEDYEIGGTSFWELGQVGDNWANCADGRASIISTS